MPRPDVVFVRPPAPLAAPDAPPGMRTLAPPPFLALLAGYVRGLGFGVEILDARAAGLSPERAAWEVRGLSPRLCVVWVSALDPEESTPAMEPARAMVEELGQEAFGVPTLLGGLHPSALPRETLLREKPDYVCQGQGFSTLPALLEALRNGQAAPAVPGLWLKSRPDAPPGVPAPARRDLENLPLPAWDLLPMDRYRAPVWMSLSHPSRHGPFASVFTSLGCPFSCAHCAQGALAGRPGVLFRSPDKVLEEMEILSEHHGVNNVALADPLFCLDERRVETLCKKIRERGLSLCLSARARPDTLTERMLNAMAGAGFRWLELEANPPDLRLPARSVFSRRPAPDRALAAARNAGMHVFGKYRMGLPDDDFEVLNHTLASLLESRASWIRVRPAMPFPGSRLYQTALSQGWPLPQAWTGFDPDSPEARHPGTRFLSGEQVLDFCDYAQSAWFANPDTQDRMGRTFGQRALSLVKTLARPRRP